MGRRAVNSKRKKRRRTIIVILIIAAAMITGTYFFLKTEFKITKVNITGSEIYTYDELYDYIFQNCNDKNILLYKYTSKKAGEPIIPFISQVDTDIEWPHTLNFTVYEKSLIGYVEYKGSNMYLDKDGVVVDSSDSVFDNTPLITGLKFDSIVLYDKLKVENDSVFNGLHNLSQYISKYDLKLDRIEIASDNTFSLIVGGVTVLLGQNDDYMGEKIYELSCMINQFDGLNGTLHMEEYTGDESYIMFKQKDEKK